MRLEIFFLNLLIGNTAAVIALNIPKFFIAQPGIVKINEHSNIEGRLYTKLTRQLATKLNNMHAICQNK